MSQTRDGEAKAFLRLPASLNLKSQMKNHSSPIALPAFFHIFLLENLA
ncbi:hypothetical protein QT970_18820 [Microcoleus sp. herbarium8]